MDDVRLRRAIRAIRLHRRLRQVDLARISGLSQATISDVERGHAGTLSLRSVRAIVAALGADASVEIRWRSGDVDRLLDERHAALARAAVDLLVRRGWRVATEVTYSHYGERGAYDVLAVPEVAGLALAVEAKTRLVSLEATLRKLDEKVRLAPKVAADRFAMRPHSAIPMLVRPEGTASRRSVAMHDAILRRALPVRGAAARAWLAAPDATASGILLVVTPSRTGGTGPAGGAGRARRSGRAGPGGLGLERRPPDPRVSTLGLREVSPAGRAWPIEHGRRQVDHHPRPPADTRWPGPVSQSGE